jgi:hypothetical protein
MTRLTKSVTKAMTTAAAVLLVTAGVASAQSTMKAEVPFAFTVNNKVIEPGTIRVRFSGQSVKLLFVDNFDTKQSYIAMPQSSADAPKDWVESGQAKLAFDCSSGTCVLARVWRGEGSAYDVYRPKTRSGDVHLTEIVMKPDKGD